MDNRGEKGSYTVEATLVFTFLILVVFAFIFGIMVLYQHVFLQKSVNSAVLYATVEHGGDGDTDVKQTDIYDKINEELKKSIFPIDDVEQMVRFERKSSLTGDTLKVTICQEIHIPLGQIKQFFSGKDTITISANATTITDNSIQTIRYTDLGIELLNRGFQ